MRYEKHFGRELRQEFGDENVVLDQWITFSDCRGQNFACIDAHILGPYCILLIECKLTWTELAWYQMEKRYAPLLRHYYRRPVATLQVCKNLEKGRRLEPEEHRTPRKLLDNPEPGRFTHHWLGR